MNDDGQKLLEHKPKNPEKVKQGKRNSANGAKWERRVRVDLEDDKQLFVSKFQNNMNLETNKMVAAKGGRFRRISTGFPDFIVWTNKRFFVTIEEGRLKDKDTQNSIKATLQNIGPYQTIVAPDYVKITPDCEVWGVECKSNGYLDRDEKAKCKWLLERKIFSKIMIARKKKEGRKVIPEYIDFEEYIKNGWTRRNKKESTESNKAEVVAKKTEQTTEELQHSSSTL